MEYLLTHILKYHLHIHLDLQPFPKCIWNFLDFTENLYLKSKLLFGYLEQDNYKTQFLVKGLVTKLQFEPLISFHANSLIS